VIGRLGVCLASLMVLSFVKAPAQAPRKPADTLPIQAGPFQLYPLFAAVVEQTDNLFYTSSERINATVTSVTPGISAEVPLPGDGELYMGYALRYRNYGGADIDSNLSHFLLAGGGLDFGNGFLLAFEEDYSRGVLDTTGFDAGGEVVFRGDEFAAAVTSLDLSHQRTARRRVGVSVEKDHVEFQESAQAGLYDSDYYNVDLYADHQVGAQGGVRLGVYGSKGDLTSVENPADRRDEQTFRLTLGGQWRLSPSTSLGGDFGWGTAEFFDELEGETSKTRNLVGALNFVRFVPTRARVVARVSQGVFPSFYGDNTFYVSRALFVQIENDPRARMSLGGSASYTQNDYPEAAPARTDDTVDGKAWVGYRFGSGVEWRVYVETGSRSSVRPELEYDATSVGVMLGLGSW